MLKLGKVTSFIENLVNGGTNCAKLSDLQIFKEVDFFYNWDFEWEEEANI